MRDCLHVSLKEVECAGYNFTLFCQPAKAGHFVPAVLANCLFTMLILPGSHALSASRLQRLLAQLKAIDPAIIGLSSRYYHFVDTHRELVDDDKRHLSAMLTYGEPFTAEESGEQFIVIPRLGTISPWASKATDIAHHCSPTTEAYARAGTQTRQNAWLALHHSPPPFTAAWLWQQAWRSAIISRALPLQILALGVLASLLRTRLGLTLLHWKRIAHPA